MKILEEPIKYIKIYIKTNILGNTAYIKVKDTVKD